MNRLIREKSPYLLQHKDNPVDWYPWGEEAFEVARRDEKPIFLSIGYSTCYWCHVMEKDSFETAEVAQVLNEYFVSIKVDREERPDLEQIYMDAVVGLTGHGGWPMTVFLTPDKKPFWGGTFFYRKQFLEILGKLHAVWRDERSRILSAADGITAALAERVIPSAGSDAPLSLEIFERAVRRFEESFDDTDGGFGGAPKFPPSQQLRFLLRDYHRSGRGESLAMVETTLDRMMRGGIYDHLGGGFSRYATDARWIVPHFEKMLYDNALLAVTYLEAFQVTKKSEYRVIVDEILGYVGSVLSSPEGGFFSAEDAGEVGKEGEFYVFSPDELTTFLSGEEYALAERVLGLSDVGNFEHGATILNVPRGIDWSERDADLARALRAKLLALRSTRPRPHLDDKVLTSWNGMMITAFARAGTVLGEPRYLERAKVAAEFIESKLLRDDVLLHRYRDGEGAIEGTLDDYAFFIEALLSLYVAASDPHWVHLAVRLQAKQDDLLFDREGGGYFYSAAPDLLLRKKEVLDGATPAANSVAADNLVRLFELTGESRYLERAQATVGPLGPVFERHPSAVPRALLVVDALLGPRTTVVVVPAADGQGARLHEEARREYLPRVLVVAASGFEEPAIVQGKKCYGDTSTVYRCTDKGCSAPVVDFDSISDVL